jgi:fibronectin type 3 domain-containing protein
VGTFAGSLTISSNSSTGSSKVVSLSGTGTAVQHEVTLTWNGPANSPVPVTGYNVYRSPSGGTTFQRLNSTSDSQTSYVDQAVQSKASYIYYVKSVDAAGTESTSSSQTTITIP